VIGGCAHSTRIFPGGTIRTMPATQAYRIVGPTAIGSILFKGMLVEFAVDITDLSAVKAHKWHYTTNGYVATSIRNTDISGSTKKREIYLHNFLLSPGAEQVVYHISKNGLDNRRINLRLVNSTDPGAAVMAAAQVVKRRNVELPPLCGVSSEEIPKHIWYVQANGYHRDRFAIEFKTEGILWKSTSSKKVSLKEKLEQAKQKLEELYGLFPHLDPRKEEAQIAELSASFDALFVPKS
jgi:hypothetical protein